MVTLRSDLFDITQVVIKTFSGDYSGKLCSSEPPQEANGSVCLDSAGYDQTIWWHSDKALSPVQPIPPKKKWGQTWDGEH